MSLPVVVLTRSGLRRLGHGHPWIFPDHVAAGLDGEAGLVRLEAPAGTPRGAAVLNPDSRIPLRVVSRRPDFGAEEAEAEGWWARRLDRAVRARAFRLAVGAEACRWVHAEADGLPGLVVDRYGLVAVIQAGCRWADDVAPRVAEVLVKDHGVHGVLARHDGSFRRHESLPEGVTVLAGEVPPTVTWRNPGGDGLLIETDLYQGHKTGGYLDQRSNHLFAAAQLEPGGRVLDAFCYEGGFALHLAAGTPVGRGGRSLGRRDVVAWDGSGPALERARVSAERNGLGEHIDFEEVNVFEALRKADADGERFDGIVLDPPALTKTKRDRESAWRGYKELNLRALKLLDAGGRLFTCSCSYHIDGPAFLQILREAANDARKDVAVLAVRAAGPDHPRRLAFPESDYLKAVLLEVRGEA